MSEKKRASWLLRWKLFRSAVGNLIDLGDALYASGVILIAVGAGWFHPGAGFMAAGCGVVFPFVLAMVRGGAPPKGKP
jgi:hypothetical protein